ncbi:hypothetical protein GCM10010232_35450 [Streptomyces amakusaensis]|uniref:Uncharacterized protein n=2 Tax=Streptomyces TaxID=1883 RepID=A0A918Q710_9ACTN|nr:hypothetical protein [Streptomyces inusitatus]GGZ35531.1 hypothetical protein GCM10010387_32000 [Streptomyces inusitatus]
MYEDPLPKTGLAISIGGVSIGLSWLIGVSLVLIVIGILVIRYWRRRENA